MGRRANSQAPALGSSPPAQPVRVLYPSETSGVSLGGVTPAQVLVMLVLLLQDQIDAAGAAGTPAAEEPLPPGAYCVEMLPSPPA
ncbi:MAG: hypothetical protein ABJZ69_01670 [Hyphomicrobiales bacterium]